MLQKNGEKPKMSRTFTLTIKQDRKVILKREFTDKKKMVHAILSWWLQSKGLEWLQNNGVKQ